MQENLDVSETEDINNTLTKMFCIPEEWFIVFSKKLK